MYTGKRFRLKTETLGIEEALNKRVAVQVPPGEIVTVLSGPRPDDRRLVDVLWGKRKLVMFTQDIDTRGEAVRSQTTA